MAAPFCTACGATVAEGTRFCVKCGQPVGQAAPPSPSQTLVFTPAAPPPPPPLAPASAPPPPPEETRVWAPPPPPPPPPRTQNIAETPFPAPPIPAAPVPVQVKDGPGVGLWIGVIGILLLLGGAGLWFYTTRAHGVLTAQDAGPVTTPPPAQPTPAPTPEASTVVPAPTPNPTPEDVPANPDQAQKDAAPAPAAPRQRAARQSEQPKVQPVQSAPVAAPPQAEPPPPQPVRAATRQTSGVLHAAVEVAQNGEVVFENLPGARLRFIFDHSLWQPTISRQPNGTQTLVMRSLKPGIQTTCDVRWEIVQ
jgi:zinc-ribbon domain